MGRRHRLHVGVSTNLAGIVSISTAKRLPALRAESVSKSFGDNAALDDFHVEIPASSVHALVGMNGSGKSTFVKILAGFYQRDAGSVEVGGDGDNFSDRIAFVHQDLALVESLTVLENLGLGRKVPTRRWRIDQRLERARVIEALQPFDLESKIDTPVDALTKAEKTIVAIARALQASADCSLLVLDEPTSTLPARETQRLLDVTTHCAASGLGVLFISHRLGEVMRVSDAVTVLRNGRAVQSAPTSELSVDRIVTAMGGTSLAPVAVSAPTTTTTTQFDRPPVLRAAKLSGETLRGIDLDVHRGEVVGVAGILGSGVEELGLLLTGRADPTGGSVELGKTKVARDPRMVGFVPANRATQAVLPGLTARENATVCNMRPYLLRGRINVNTERSRMYELFEAMGVHPLDPDVDMLALSGGNQQKVLFSRWLAVNPNVLVADEPTQGVDVYAKGDILAKLRQHAADGLAVVLISGEPEEIAAACDRMVVINNGRVSAEITAPVDVSSVLTEMHKGDIHGHS